MKENEIRAKIRQALNYAAVGGLRASLFADTNEEDTEMMLEFLTDIPRSQKNLVSEAIKEWQEDFKYLKHLPDKEPNNG